MRKRFWSSFSLVISCAALLVLASTELSHAADSYTVANGANLTITEHSVCRVITNNHASGSSIMVPTKTAAEWSSGANAFINAPPAGVTVGNCPCNLPWGGSIAHGANITAYSSTAPAAACSTVQETRNCTNGTLSGSFTNQSCTNGCSSTTVSWLTNCSANSGTALAHGGSRTITNSAGGFSGTRDITCSNGAWNQSGGSCTAACGGVSMGGYCWYYGSTNQDCNTVCSSRGGCNVTGLQAYGSGGTESSCNTLLSALGAAGTSTLNGGSSASWGCGNASSLRIRYTASTTCGGAGPTFRRACACNN